MKFLGSSIFLFMACCASAHAEDLVSTCAKSLQFTDIRQSDSLDVRYAYLMTKIEEAEQHKSGSVGISYAGIGLSLSQAKDMASRMQSQLGVNWSRSEAHGYIARFISADANSTFRQCVHDVLTSNEPVRIEVVRQDQDQITLKVHIGSNASEHAGLALDLESNGAFASGIQRRWTMAGGAPTIIIGWRSPGRDLNIQARVLGSSGELGSDAVTIPPKLVMRTSDETVDKESDVSRARCGGVPGRPNEGYGDEVILTAAPNGKFDLDNITERQSANFGKPGYSLSRPEQAHMVYEIKSPDRIVAKAWCSIYANEQFGWDASIVVPEIETKTTIVSVPMGEPSPMHRAPPA